MGHPWRRRRLAARKASAASATSARKATASSNAATRTRTGASGSTGSLIDPGLIRSDLEAGLYKLLIGPSLWHNPALSSASPPSVTTVTVKGSSGD